MTFSRLILTVICFVLFVALVIPASTLSALYVAASTRIWLAVLAIRYSKLQFVGRFGDIRSHVDTKRNHGVHHVLLELHGSCDVYRIKKSLLSTVLAVKPDDRTYMFPRLRQRLAKPYGFYAWHSNSENSFNIDNHVVATVNPVVRGRIVTHSNIQEYVSQAASRYLSTDQPPWHIELIHVVTEDRNHESVFALVRIHHMLLAESHHLSLRLFLQLDSDIIDKLPYPQPNNELNHLLTQLQLKRASYCQRLANKVAYEATSFWTRFVNKFQSQHPSSGLAAFAAKSLIVLIRRAQQCMVPKQMFIQKNEDLNYETAIKAIRKTIEPFQLATNTKNLLMFSARVCFIYVPQFVYSECYLIFRSVFGKVETKSVLIGFVLELVTAVVELWNVAIHFVTGPLCLLEILFNRRLFNRNAVHNVPIQGRRSLAWSDTENALASGSLEKSLRGIYASLEHLQNRLKKEPNDKYQTPHSSSVAIRSLTWEHILENEKGCNYPYLCKNLPIGKSFSERHDSDVSIVFDQTASIWIQQNVPQYLHLFFSSPVIHVLINFVSKRFPITITWVDGDLQPSSAWDTPVKDAVFFSTTQCNTGLSIMLERLNGKRRISVMSDTHFNTHLPRFVSTWLDHMEI